VICFATVQATCSGQPNHVPRTWTRPCARTAGPLRERIFAKHKVAERKSPAEVAEVDETAEVVEAEIVEDEAQPGADLEQAIPPITGEEYRARFLAALAAERYAAGEKRRLANVNVADDALAVVVEFLDGSRTSGGQYLLLDDDGSESLRRELLAGDAPSES
jgi:hypothetical protein